MKVKVIGRYNDSNELLDTEIISVETGESIGDYEVESVEFSWDMKNLPSFIRPLCAPSSMKNEQWPYKINGVDFWPIGT